MKESKEAFLERKKVSIEQLNKEYTKMIKYMITIPWILLAALWITVSVYSCSAQADSLQFTIGSKHFNKNTNKTYQEVNPGVFYERDINKNWSLIAGAYRNTLNAGTVAIGAEYKIGITNNLLIGAQAGIGTGYKEITGKAINPIGSIIAQYRISKRLSIRASIIPAKEVAVGFGFVIDL